MVYNNGFPVGYQQIYPQYQSYPQYQQILNPQQIQQPAMQSANTNNVFTWVQGESGAKSYMIAPNTTVELWDSEAQTIYLKSADANGLPSMKILDYTIRDEQQSVVPNIPNNESTFATKEDIAAIRKEMDKFKNRIDAISGKKDQRKEYKQHE